MTSERPDGRSTPSPGPSTQRAFGRDVATLLSGTGVAEGIAIAAAPVLTRLYAADEIGVWALYMAMVTTLATVVSLRYELAIILPEADSRAASIFNLSVLLCVPTSLTAFAVIVPFRHRIAAMLDAPGLASLLWFLPASLLLVGFHKAASFWATRKRNFSQIALSQVGRSTALHGTQIGAGMIPNAAGASSLLVGSLVSQVVAATILGRSVLRGHYRLLTDSLGWAEMQRNVVEHRNFPIYTAPYSFLSGLSKQALYFLLVIFYGTQVVGYFAIARKLVYLPITFLSN